MIIYVPSGQMGPEPEIFRSPELPVRVAQYAIRPCIHGTLRKGSNVIKIIRKSLSFSLVLAAIAVTLIIAAFVVVGCYCCVTKRPESCLAKLWIRIRKLCVSIVMSRNARSPKNPLMFRLLIRKICHDAVQFSCHENSSRYDAFLGSKY